MEIGIGTREALPIEPRVTITVIKEGSPSVLPDKEKFYQGARANLFNPHIKFSPELVKTTLQARAEELDEAIQNSPLKGSTDRGGYPLNSLKELNTLALQELSGELQAKTVLKRTLEMISNEEEASIREEADNATREGVQIDKKTGSIVFISFPSDDKREIASIKAQNMKQDFLKGKERVQTFISGLK